jgi:hypothetical protein
MIKARAEHGANPASICFAYPVVAAVEGLSNHRILFNLTSFSFDKMLGNGPPHLAIPGYVEQKCFFLEGKSTSHGNTSVVVIPKVPLVLRMMSLRLRQLAILSQRYGR